MKHETILEAVLQSEELPTLPTVASKLISMTSNEDTTLSDIAELVSRDIALSTKILKVSNSAFYSFPQQIGSIHQAVSILGTNAVRSLVLSFSFLSITAGKQKSSFNFERFWQRSLALAVASKLVLEKVKGADTEEIFISGLLQNLGELIFARTYSRLYDKVITAVNDDQHDSIAAEEQIIGANHCIVGHEVAKSWGFPDVLTLPILHHHSPESYKGANTKIKQTICAVYLSDLIINILYSDTPQDYHKQFQKEAKKLLRLSPEDISSILDQVHYQVEQAGEYFGLKIKNQRSIQEILQEANIRLSLLNLDYDQMNKQLIKAKMELEKLTRELEEKNRILDNLANVDGLTEVFNHRYFQSTLAQEIERSVRNDNVLSLLLCDIDHFKQFNDTYGHLAGDFILKDFCRVLQSNLRKYDTLARYGGEEFVIILPETDAEEAFSVAEKLRKAIEDTTFDDGDQTYTVRASFGVATSRPSIEDNFTNSSFIGNADQALYNAKQQGRNRTSSHSAKKKWYQF